MRAGVFVATFQVAIALGAVFGGLLVDNAGVAAAFGYCVVAMALAVLLMAGARRARPA